MLSFLTTFLGWVLGHVVGRILRLRRNTEWQEYANFNSLLSGAGLGNLGKGGFVTPSIEDCLTRLMGSSNQARTGCTDLQFMGSRLADCQALT